MALFLLLMYITSNFTYIKSNFRYHFFRQISNIIIKILIANIGIQLYITTRNTICQRCNQQAN